VCACNQKKVLVLWAQLNFNNLFLSLTHTHTHTHTRVHALPFSCNKKRYLKRCFVLHVHQIAIKLLFRLKKWLLDLFGKKMGLNRSRQKIYKNLVGYPSKLFAPQTIWR